MRSANQTLGVLFVALLLSACGGGGGGDSGSSSGGSSGGSGGGTVTPVTGTNVVALTVDSGPTGVSGRIANVPYATVTICAPGTTSNCQTIDHVLVDTGSIGLRIMASALNGNAAYPQVTTTAGTPLLECATFISGYTWGSVRSASVQLGGLTSSAIPIQIVGDTAYPTVPTACANTGTAQNTVADLGAKGILGIGHFVQDAGAYFACSSAGSCTATSATLAQQLTHPIARMPSDNNGSMIQFPTVSTAGQTTASGSLVMGIGTRTNNAVGSATAYGVSRSTGLLSTAYNGRTYSRSAFDSGSNFYFFTDASLPICSSSSSNSRYYCPATAQTLSAVVTGTNAVSGTVSFRLANANSLFTTSSSTAVLPDIGADIGVANVFLWGLPFFYGRSVFTSIVDQSTPLGTGPFVAF